MTRIGRDVVVEKTLVDSSCVDMTNPFHKKDGRWLSLKRTVVKLVFIFKRLIFKQRLIYMRLSFKKDGFNKKLYFLVRIKQHSLNDID